MKNAILLQAKYNKHANSAMFSTLKAAPAGSFTKQSSTYFKSIAAECEHLLGVQIAVFLGNFSNFCAKKVDCAELLGAINADLSLKAEFKELDKMASLCEKVDSKIIEIIENTNDFESGAVLEFPGVKFEKTRAFLELAIFNHSTHHRGIVAAALDSFGVENDFNGMLGMPQ